MTESNVGMNPVEFAIDALSQSDVYGIFITHAIEETGDSKSVFVFGDKARSQICRWKKHSEVERRNCLVSFPRNLLAYLSKLGLWECDDYAPGGAVLDGETYIVIVKDDDGKQRKVTIENPQFDYKYKSLLNEFGRFLEKTNKLYEIRTVLRGK